MEILITIILIIIFFQFLPLVLIVSGVLNIFAGNPILGIVLLIFGLMMAGRDR